MQCPHIHVFFPFPLLPHLSHTKLCAVHIFPNSRKINIDFTAMLPLYWYMIHHCSPLTPKEGRSTILRYICTCSISCLVTESFNSYVCNSTYGSMDILCSRSWSCHCCLQTLITDSGILSNGCNCITDSRSDCAERRRGFVRLGSNNGYLHNSLE